MTGTPWPSHRKEALPWEQKQRGGTKEDRMLREISASIPPLIAELEYSPSLEAVRASEGAILAVAAADADAEGQSAALSRFLIRSESVASSKIERIEASVEDYAKAVAGSRKNSSATSMVAASSALQQLVDNAGNSGKITVDALTAAHAALMRDDPDEKSYAGRPRDMQNWIGGSDHSPRDALFVPPAPGRVAELMGDLIAYVNRNDIPALMQASFAHAQFESIHPFTDGNGRIGRALVGASLRRRGVTRNAVIPVASGILARRDDYFAALTTYREGNPEPIFILFADSARVAATEARVSIARIKSFPDEWAIAAKARKGSAAATLIPALYDNPVMTTAVVESVAGVSLPQVYAAIDRLEEASVVREITGRKRDRVWVAADIVDELGDLDHRIYKGMSRT